MPTIRKADEAMLVKLLTGLIYGDASSGKTTLSGTSKRALILDGDRGAYRALHRPDTLEVQSWQDILDVVADDVLMSGYDTIVVDTVGTVLDFLAERIAKLPGKN
ncbi:MAG: AAA family ATPase, partial [Candidatus Kapabacteria bacterium]|nr:AAA family ATPase [Candidatus Kapabacteria bacterium]